MLQIKTSRVYQASIPSPLRCHPRACPWDPGCHTFKLEPVVALVPTHRGNDMHTNECAMVAPSKTEIVNGFEYNFTHRFPGIWTGPFALAKYPGSLPLSLV